jgi:pyrroloquinoline quinone biosynthesis protein B
MLRILVLGSAAGGGFPQWNCGCVNCRRARSGDPAAIPRTQSTLAVTADDENWFLLNASPDLRQQILQAKPLHPVRGARHSPIVGVVLTNADVDHIAGLLTLRERQALTLYATRRVHDVLASNVVFDVLSAESVDRRSFELDREIELDLPDGRPSGLAVELFAVPGKVALYLEKGDAGSGFGTVAEDAVGARVTSRSDGRGFFYVPGCAALPDELANRLRGAEVVFFDGTTWTDDEMRTSGVGVKTGRRMGHMCMSGPDGSIAAFAGLEVDRKIFVHINNTNPALLSDSPERAEAEAAGWEIAEDGLDIRL